MKTFKNIWKHLTDPNTFSEYWNTMDDVYNNSNDYFILDAGNWIYLLYLSQSFFSKKSQIKFYTLLNNEDSQQKEF